ncbi:hypothetical protein [Sphingopyxis fribergensis]
MSNPKAARLGLILDVDVKVSAEWKELAGALAASAADFFLKGAGEAASSGVSGLIKFVSSLKANPSPGYRAWNLAVVSFAWALDQMLPDSDRSAAIKSIKKSVEKSRISAENDGVFLPLDFIERPTNFQLYVNLRNDFILNTYENLDQKSINELKYKIDSSFSVAIFEILSKRMDNFKSIVDALGIPGAASAELSLSWTTYRSKLIYDFNAKPLFGQEDTNISLSQLYVPLRGF